MRETVAMTSRRRIFGFNRFAVAVLFLAGVLVPQFPGAPSAAEPSASTLIGCYADNSKADPMGTDRRDLDGAAFKDPSMTVDICVGLCADQGFNYAGLQDGSWCFCGNEFGRFPQSAAICQTKCTGDNSQTCGGKWANSVWALTTAAQLPSGSPSATTPPPVATREPEEISLSARVIRVGRWPEGIAFDGKSLWVAESGVRRVAQIDPKRRKVLRRVKVGRLPVDMAARAGDGVYALVQTSKTLWRQAGRKGRRFARFKECPQAMAADNQAIYVVAWIDCGSSRAQLYKIDPVTAKVSELAKIGPTVHSAAAINGQVFVGNYNDRGPALSRIDGTTGKLNYIPAQGGGFYDIVANDRAVYASGGIGTRGVIIGLFVADLDRMYRQVVDDDLVVVTATNQHVVVIGERGTIWVLSADNLGVQRIINTDFGPFRPNGVLAVGDRLYVTTQVGEGKKGTLLEINGWLPNGTSGFAAAEVVEAEWRSGN